MPNLFYTQFCFKQFSLALVHSFNVKTVLLQTIQFSISTQFSSISPIDKTLSGGACGVMVIVVGNGHGDTSSYPGRD